MNEGFFAQNQRPRFRIHGLNLQGLVQFKRAVGQGIQYLVECCAFSGQLLRQVPGVGDVFNRAVQATAAAQAVANGLKAEAKPEPKSENKPEPKAEPKTESKNDSKLEAKPDAKEAAKAKALLDGKEAPKAADAVRSVVQVGAYADLAKAKEARAKLESAGFKTYTQEIDTKDGKRIRVRVGPFATKEEADKTAEKIRKLNLQASVLKL